MFGGGGGDALLSGSISSSPLTPYCVVVVVVVVLWTGRTKSPSSTPTPAPTFSTSVACVYTGNFFSSNLIKLCFVEPITRNVTTCSITANGAVQSFAQPAGMTLNGQYAYLYHPGAI